MSSPLRNGDTPPPRLPSPAVGRHHFHSTVSEKKIRRLNALILLLRLAAFCFSLAAAIFMATNSSRSPGSHSWLHFHPFRLVLASNAIVAVYSFFEMVSSIWEILKGVTLFPEPLQLWFDFSHDQVFAYLLLAAEAAATVEAQGLKGAHTCSPESAFCVQAYISVALGFAGFAFLALAALGSGFRVACYVITGSRFHL
ncbi:CASP-like protein 4C1 [Phoenix dactylifera]|uniref:CASP-like protein n=1 Tax=Phoenix dactylifera TaxID=42345 RepID=A0A8B7CN64_PHODC|nr:CASP-like protein 4C1 [Phoenix dactylifera]